MSDTVKIPRPKFPRNDQGSSGRVAHDTRGNAVWVRSRATDTVDVNHEYGHMLGALDEYFTVNGVNYGAGRQPAGNIMNNPANQPIATHYDVVRATASGLLGTATGADLMANGIDLLQSPASAAHVLVITAQNATATLARKRP